MKTKTPILTLPIFSWCLYDFANSAFPTLINTFIFATFFTQSIAINPILGTQQWSLALSIGGLITALLSPFFGAIADKKGSHKRWLACFTTIVIITGSLLWFAKPTSAYVFYSLLLVNIGTISLEIAMVFYNAMLSRLVPEKYVGRVSGWGWGMGYLGGLSCLLLALLMLKNHQIRFVGPLVALWLLMFSLPLFLLTPETYTTHIPIIQAIKEGIRNVFITLKKWRKYPTVFLFLLAHMFFIDGLNTIFAFGGIYAAGIFKMAMPRLILFGLATNISAGLGAICLAWLDDLWGSKETILISLGGMLVFGCLVLGVQTEFTFWILAIGLCFFVGPVQAASRSYLIHIAPSEQMTQMFGLFALSGKITAFASPFLLGIVTLYTQSQRIGMYVPLAFILLGGVLLVFVRTRHNIPSPPRMWGRGLG